MSGTKAPYCVAKYGTKWVRTRTLLNTNAPRWNEQYTWEVADACTIMTVAVFDNCHVSDKGGTDKKIGKVRIRISTLQTDRVYTHFYPLLTLQPSGLKKNGELHLAVRFTCTAWVNMLLQYSRPLLPKMHYSQPISIMQQDQLRARAVALLTERLGNSEPPLRKEVVDYILEVPSHMWSMRKSKANFYRVTSLTSSLSSIGKWISNIVNWKNPFTTLLVHVLFITLVFFPELILPTIFLYLFAIGMSNYRFRPDRPPHLDPKLSLADVAFQDELDEEFDTFPTSKNMDTVRFR
jgi:Plant phosphoribosyltransferase C-terminal/C2 domain